MATKDVHVKTRVSQDILKLLKEYPELRLEDKKGKVCCCLTGHEMPADEEVIKSYVGGKKFLKAQMNREFDFKKYEPHLIPSNKKGHKNELFCMLTLRHVTRRPADIERHVAGKRYQRALQRWKKCQESGEVFKPRGGKRQQNDTSLDDSKPRAFWESDDDEEYESHDSLKDLYPDIDFLGEEQPEAQAKEDAKVEAGRSPLHTDGDEDAADDDYDFDCVDVSDSKTNTEKSHSECQKRTKKQSKTKAKRVQAS